MQIRVESMSQLLLTLHSADGQKGPGQQLSLGGRVPGDCKPFVSFLPCVSTGSLFSTAFVYFYLSGRGRGPAMLVSAAQVLGKRPAPGHSEVIWWPHFSAVPGWQARVGTSPFIGSDQNRQSYGDRKQFRGRQGLGGGV